jgi:uncharacterized protein YceK
MAYGVSDKEVAQSTADAPNVRQALIGGIGGVMRLDRLSAMCLAVLAALALSGCGRVAGAMSTTPSPGKPAARAARSFALVEEGKEGTSTTRDLRAGQTIVLDNGATLTIPKGVDAGAPDYGYVHWAPGSDTMSRSEYLIAGHNLPGSDPKVRGDSNTVTDIMEMSVYDPDALPDYAGMVGGTLIARSRDALVYSSSYGLRIELHLPGRERGWILLDGTGDQPYASLERFWTRFRVGGVALPPKV